MRLSLGGAPADTAGTSQPKPESLMTPRPIDRAAAFALALMITLGTAGAIDHLAVREPASALWAAAVVPARG